MSTEPYIRVSVCFKKNPKLSDVEFNDYWANNHGPLCTEWMKKFGLLRYIQMHVDKTHLQTLSNTIGWRLADFDGIADFHVRKMDDFFQAFGDEYYQNTLFVDEEEFVDHSTTIMTIGYDYAVIENDEVVTDHVRDFKP